MATRVLLTGASGFVGSHVLRYLLAQTDWQFVCVCSWRHHGSPLRLEPDKRVTVLTHDLSAPLPELGDFDFILNLASESHVDRSIAEPVAFIENNVSATLNTLEYARHHPPRLFLHFSTDEVFGTVAHQAADALLPSNPYAASKAAQEMIAQAYYRTYDLPLIITNSNNIIGEGQDPEKFLPKIIHQIRHGEQVTIHAVNGRPGKRWYNPVQNVAAALLFLLQQPFTELRRYSIPGGELLDNLELALLVSQKLRKPLGYCLVEASTVRPGYDEFYAAADAIPGWQPPLTLEEGLSWIT